ncbi:MAG: InlB B-repeat-containing protein, partial [Chloroflexota bacterium]
MRSIKRALLGVSLLFAGLIGGVGLASAVVTNTFTFNCDPGVAGAGPGTTYTQTELNDGTAYALDAEDCTYSGRVFGGWAASPVEAEAATVRFANLQPVKFNTTRSLYAIWLGTFTVTFDANLGTGTMPDQSEDSNNTNLSANSGQITRAGFTFDGWNTELDGSGDAYADGASFDFVVEGDTTLYAQWQATIAFDKNDPAATGSMTSQSESSNTALDANTCALEGYNFAGWNTE